MWLDDEKQNKINDLLEKMQKNIVSPADIERFITFLIKTIEKSKSEISSLSAENIKVIKQGIAQLEAFHEKQAKAIDDKTNIATGQFDTKLALLKDLIGNIKKIKATPGKDGVDGVSPDPSEVVPLVLEKIKLPEYKETVLDDREKIVEKINSGKKKDLKIELKQIEGAETLSTQASVERAMSILDQRTKFLINKQGGSGGGTWGSITGTLSNQTDLQTALDAKVSYQLPENTPILLDAVLSADGKYSATKAQSGTLGETVAFGEVVYFKPADSKWYKASATTTTTSGGRVGVCVVAGNVNDTTTILFRGNIRADSLFPTFTIAGQVYISETSGAMTQTAPTPTDTVTRVVGFAETADSVDVDVSGDWITHT